MPSGDRIESAAAVPAPAPDPAAPAPQASESAGVNSTTESPETAPIGESAPADAPTPIEAPGETAPPVEPEKPAEPEPASELKPHTETPTLMELAGKEEPPKTEGEAPPAAEPTQPRSYEPFTLPEGLALDPARVTEAATNLFAADNLPQERAQAYVDFHIAEMQRYAAAQAQQHHDQFANMRADWVKQVLADPEMGGNGHQTAMTSIAMARDLFVSAHPQTSEQYQREMAEFNDFLRITGAGDHPAFNRLMLNVARKWQEPAAPAITFKPPPDIGRRPNGAANGRRATLYGTVDTTPR
jgi:hypothetical protein